jgi:hypothetical protein
MIRISSAISGPNHNFQIVLSYAVNCIIITPRPFRQAGIFFLRRDIIGANLRLGWDRIVSGLG